MVRTSDTTAAISAILARHGVGAGTIWSAAAGARALAMLAADPACRAASDKVLAILNGFPNPEDVRGLRITYTEACWAWRGAEIDACGELAQAERAACLRLLEVDIAEMRAHAS